MLSFSVLYMCIYLHTYIEHLVVGNYVGQKCTCIYDMYYLLRVDWLMLFIVYYLSGSIMSSASGRLQPVNEN